MIVGAFSRYSSPYLSEVIFASRFLLYVHLCVFVAVVVDYSVLSGITFLIELPLFFTVMSGEPVSD